VTDILEEALADAAKRRTEALAKPPPIPCLGRWTHTTDGSDFDCDYPKAGKIGCEDCIVNGGAFDPRTGRRVRRKRGETTS
jgi:hypothetical protein